jgi:hypothetical protein
MTQSERIEKIYERLEDIAVDNAETKQILTDIAEKCKKFSSTIYGNGQVGLVSEFRLVDNRLDTIEEKAKLDSNMKRKLILNFASYTFIILLGWVLGANISIF